MQESLSVALAITLVSTTGCGIKMLRPIVPGFDDDHQQASVEATLRGNTPDADLDASAFRHFSAGCNFEDPAMCSALGVLYEMGRGVRKDHARAFELYTSACQAGNDCGCVNQGLAHLNGVGTKIDVANAAALFQIGCDGGNDRGCTELATMQQMGIGRSASPQGAAELFQRSCSRGDAESCYKLGGMFDDETLGPDPITMLELYERACALGHNLSCKRVDTLYAQMRNSQPRHPDDRCPPGTECTPGGVAASVR